MHIQIEHRGGHHSSAPPREYALSDELAHVFRVWRSARQEGADGDAGLPKRARLLGLDWHMAGKSSSSRLRVAILARHDRYNFTIGLMRGQGARADIPITGINAFDLITPPLRETAAVFYSDLLDHPAGAVVHERRPQISADDLGTTLLFLPLADQAGKARYLLGASLVCWRTGPASLKDHIFAPTAADRSVEMLDLGAGVPERRLDWSVPRGRRPNSPAAHRAWWHRFVG